MTLILKTLDVLENFRIYLLFLLITISIFSQNRYMSSLNYNMNYDAKSNLYLVNAKHSLNSNIVYEYAVNESEVSDTYQDDISDTYQDPEYPIEKLREKHYKYRRMKIIGIGMLIATGVSVPAGIFTTMAGFALYDGDDFLLLGLSLLLLSGYEAVGGIVFTIIGHKKSREYKTRYEKANKTNLTLQLNMNSLKLCLEF